MTILPPGAFAMRDCEHLLRRSAKAPPVLAIGNPILNVVARVETSERLPLGLAPDESTLVPLEIWEAASSEFRADLIQPGGTSVNTVSALAMMGTRCTFVGAAGDDVNRALFEEWFAKLAIAWVYPEPQSDEVTGRCLVLVLPSGERTLITYLGSAGQLSGRILHSLRLQENTSLLTEVYQWDGVDAGEIFDFFVDQPANRERFLTLSSKLTVQAHRQKVLALVSKVRCVLIGNASEFAALIDEPDQNLLPSRIKRFLTTEAAHCEAFVTLGADGALYSSAQETLLCPTKPLAQPLDVTGAGDLFAAGVIRARALGESPALQAFFGNMLARSVIQRLGTLDIPVLSEATLMPGAVVKRDAP